VLCRSMRFNPKRMWELMHFTASNAETVHVPFRRRAEATDNDDYRAYKAGCLFSVHDGNRALSLDARAFAGTGGATTSHMRHFICWEIGSVDWNE
jgi:hypothetical protein